jgi:glutamate/tyrosine decarboxylase-like PLP-dependent enzyme
VPESSRRARGFPLYAALRSLGRRGVEDLVERTSVLARLMAAELEADPALEVINDVVINQTLVGVVGDESGELTADAVERIQQDGTCWLAATRWRGRPAIRISVCNWQTSGRTSAGRPRHPQGGARARLRMPEGGQAVSSTSTARCSTRAAPATGPGSAPSRSCRAWTWTSRR